MVRPTILRFTSRTSPIFNASRTSAEIFQRARQEAVCAGAGLETFAKSWLRRKPSNITAIPTSSPTYKAQEMLNRARDPPAAIISAPIPIHKLNDSRDRQYEYAATPIRATLPGTVNRGEKIRTLSGSAVPATGIAEASASVLTVAPATAAAVSRIRLTPAGWRPGLPAEFEEDAGERPRVDERDEPSRRAAPGLRVDELESPLPQPGHLLANVLAREREMMKSLSPPLDEPRDHAVGLKGLEELDANGPRPEEGHADALRGHLLRNVRLQTEAAISLERLLEALHRNADVVGRSDHTSCLGLYVPNTVRRTSLISPSVAFARTESKIAGIRFPSDRASSSRRWRCESTSPGLCFARKARTRRTRSGSRRGSGFGSGTRSSPST